MAECLILGAAGSGKSSVVKELLRRERIAYDADLVRGLGGWYTLDGRPVVYNSDLAWRARHQFKWDVGVLARLVKEPRANDQSTYVAGIARNWVDAVPLFGKTFYLNATFETVCQRLAAADRQTPYPFACTNDYKQDLAKFLPELRECAAALGAVIISAEADLSQIADEIIAYAQGNSYAPGL